MKLTVGYVRSIVHFWSRVFFVDEPKVLGKAALYRYITHPHDCFSIAPTRGLAEVTTVFTLIVLLVCIVGRESPQAFIHFVYTTGHLEDVTFFPPLVIGLTPTYNTESDDNIVRQSHQILTDNILNLLMYYFSQSYELRSIFKMGFHCPPGAHEFSPTSLLLERSSNSSARVFDIRGRRLLSPIGA